MQITFILKKDLNDNFIFRVTLSLFFVLALVASIHESWVIYSKCLIDAKRDSLAVRYLHCFSVINNGKKLLSTKVPPGNLACLNGLRKLFLKCNYTAYVDKLN
jgi:hypothetical protein